MANEFIQRDRLIDRLFWSRHANPKSVWTLVLSYPILIIAIYRRDRRLFVGTLLFVGMNPLVFSPPPSDDAWATRVVLGEQVWLNEGLQSPSMRLAVASVPVYVFTFHAALKRQPGRTVVGTVLSMVLMLVFFSPYGATVREPTEPVTFPILNRDA